MCSVFLNSYFRQQYASYNLTSVLFLFANVTAETFATMTNKAFENGVRVLAKAIHVTSLAECTRRFGRQHKSKIIGGKVLSIYSKKTASGRNSRYVRYQFNLGCGVTKVADVNIGSVQAAPEEDSDAIEETPVAEAEEKEKSNEQIDTINNASLAENTATLTAEEGAASATAGTILNTSQDRFDEIMTNDDSKEAENVMEEGNANGTAQTM